MRSADLELPALARAVRNIPTSGDLWLSYIRALVSRTIYRNRRYRAAPADIRFIRPF
jgi:hypothetical protein